MQQSATRDETTPSRSMQEATTVVVRVLLLWGRQFVVGRYRGAIVKRSVRGADGCPAALVAVMTSV